MKLSLILILLSSMTSLASTTSLPKGVRAFVYQHIAAQVDGYYGDYGQWNSYDIQKKLTIDTIGGINTSINNVVNQIKATSPQIFNNLEIGSIDLSAKIDVNADAFAFAYGITDKLMIGVAAPYMSAKVDIQGGYVDSGKLQATSKSLGLMANDPQYASNKDNLSILSQFISQLPTLESGNLQDIIVNYYGYKPLGSWVGSGFGDALAFIQYRFNESLFYNSAVKFEASIPTGGAKDPDNLVAVPFHNGYWGTALESLNDFYPLKTTNLVFSVNPKIQYNWPTERVMRLSPSIDFPLTKDKENVFWLPGSILSVTGGADLATNNKFFGTYLQYTIAKKFADRFEGDKPGYDYSILAHNTETLTQTAGVGIYVSTVNHYLNHQFLLPLKAQLSYSQVLSGVNSDLLKLWNLSLEMYF